MLRKGIIIACPENQYKACKFTMRAQRIFFSLNSGGTYSDNLALISTCYTIP